MKKLEIIFICLAALGLTFKVLHFPGSGVLTVLSLSLISSLYFYVGFALFNNIGFRKLFKKESYQNISSNRVVGGVATGMALSIAALGIQFKLQSWPGARVMLIFGFSSSVVITLVSLLKKSKSTDNYYPNILKRVVAFGAISIILFSIPKPTWLAWKYPNNPEYIKAVLDADKDPSNQELWDKVDLEREKMFNEMNGFPEQ
jgi:hypothetical protein